MKRRSVTVGEVYLLRDPAVRCCSRKRLAIYNRLSQSSATYMFTDR
jgi:hypothetical protein